MAKATEESRGMHNLLLKHEIFRFSQHDMIITEIIRVISVIRLYS